MKSELSSKIRNDFKKFVKNIDIIDIIIFGSAVKGKINPSDIDVAIITTNKDLEINLTGYHISIITIEDFFVKPITLINTLIREGYSILNNKKFSEIFRFESKILYTYSMKNMDNKQKVKITTLFRGKKNKGLVEKYGEWITDGTFIADTAYEEIFDEAFKINAVLFKKRYILIH
ncbi:MAG: nucleotidyltransferase domain-containing protein [Candidatus Woesearchaeota archaeon]